VWGCVLVFAIRYSTLNCISEEWHSTAKLELTNVTNITAVIIKLICLSVLMK